MPETLSWRVKNGVSDEGTQIYRWSTRHIVSEKDEYLALCGHRIPRDAADYAADKGVWCKRCKEIFDGR